MEIIKAFGIFEIIILVAGMAWPIITEVRNAWTKNKLKFEISIYWHENKWKILTGVGFSLIALVLLLAITPTNELQGVLFRFSLFACGYSPNQYIQSTMEKKKL